MTPDDDPLAVSRRSGGGWRITLSLVIIAIVAGAALITWAVMGDELRAKFGSETPSEPSRAALTDAPPAVLPPARPPAPAAPARPAPAAAAAGGAAPPSTATPGGALDPAAAMMPALTEIRLADMEDRLARLRAAADVAGAQAARGEAILVAAAARRSIERGLPLGYVGEQLQRRFADANPVAVRAILAASREPVTVEQLQGGLDDLGGRLTAVSADTGLWERIGAELSGLFTLRKAGTPSPEPAQRLMRAHRFLASGNVAAAVTEVERMPGRAAAAQWLAAARRQIATQRALDAIESALLSTAAPAPPVAAAALSPSPSAAGLLPAPSAAPR